MIDCYYNGSIIQFDVNLRHSGVFIVNFERIKLINHSFPLKAF